MKLETVVVGAASTDEVFKSAVFGAFNATAFARLLAHKPERFKLISTPINAGLLQYIKAFITIDKQWVAEMSEARRDEPVFGVTLRPPTSPPVLLIDGHHRIMRRHQDGFSTVDVWILPTRMLSKVVVTYTKVRS